MHVKHNRKFEEQMDALAVNGRRPMSESETKQYMKKLQLTKQQYQQCQRSLEIVKLNLKDLEQTEQILQSRDEHLQEYMEFKEKEKSIAKENQKILKISAMKSQYDQNKAKDLKELSTLVMKINQAVNLKKQKIKPQIDELKRKRGEFQAFEKEYLEKKGIYMNIKSGYDNEINKIQTIVNSTHSILENLKSKHESIREQLRLLNVRLEKVTKEETFQNGTAKLNSHFQCFRDMYENEINRLLLLSKSLKQEQNSIKQNHGQDIQQKKYFLSLENLLQFKFKEVDVKLAETIKEETLMNQDENDGADRLVF